MELLGGDPFRSRCARFQGLPFAHNSNHLVMHRWLVGKQVITNNFLQDFMIAERLSLFRTICSKTIWTSPQ